MFIFFYWSRNTLREIGPKIVKVCFKFLFMLFDLIMVSFCSSCLFKISKNALAFQNYLLVRNAG